MTLCAKPLLAAAALWAASAGGCATAESTGEHLRACIERIAEESDFSGVAYVARNAEAVAVVARGVRAAPGSALITPDTRFNIASAGKMFTAVAVGQLVDEGKVKFDDPIGKHVLGLPPATAAVTIRHLLTHMSGLGNFFTPDNMEALQSARSASDLLPLIDEPAFHPGTEFRYSNSGYALLGVLIERATGTTYGERLDERIFRPAGMTASGIDPEPLETLAMGMTSRQPGAGSGGPPGQPGVSSQAEDSPALRLSPRAATRGTPAGGVFTSAKDLGKFAEALWSGRLVTPATLEALVAPHVAPDPANPERAYGYGFGIRDKHGARWIGHNGGAPGANAEIVMQPNNRWLVVVLTNRDPPSATRLFEIVLAAVGPEKATACPSGETSDPS